VTPQEFGQAVAKLRDFFGERSITPSFHKVVWQFAQHMTISALMRVIDEVSMEHSRAPNPAALYAKCAPHIKSGALHRRRDEIEAMEKANTCHVCKASGLIYAFDPAHMFYAEPSVCEFTFRCPYCRAAEVRHISDKFPEWDNAKHGHLTLVKGQPMPTGRTMEDF
jgi:hypothetical protein